MKALGGGIWTERYKSSLPAVINSFSIAFRRLEARYYGEKYGVVDPQVRWNFGVRNARVASENGERLDVVLLPRRHLENSEKFTQLAATTAECIGI